MNQDIKYKVIEMLKGKRAYSCSINGKQHYTRCPYCGDSRNLSHAHLSVFIDVNADTPMMFRCLKCDTKGLVTESVLEELDLPLDQSTYKELKAYNRKAMRLGRYVDSEIEKFSVPLYQENQKNLSKLSYLNNRLGTSIDFAKARDFKVILNLFDFMVANEIKTINELSYPMMENLDQNYIGFLSCNNNCIVFRDITGKQKYRYYKVILNSKNVNADTFYSIPNKIPLLYTHDIHVHIAEGIFDILSVQQNVINSMENHYFYASCGYGGITIMKYLVHHGINTGITLHIYSDNDKTDWNHKKYLNNDITEWIDNIYIHRNQFHNEKDYGVPIDRIIDSKRKMK